LPPTEDIVGQDAIDRDAPSSPSLAKLLEKTDTDALPSRQQHFDSGGGLLHMDGGDSWGSISKMLHQRYNSGGSPPAEPAAVTGEGFVIGSVLVVIIHLNNTVTCFDNRYCFLVLQCANRFALLSFRFADHRHNHNKSLRQQQQQQQQQKQQQKQQQSDSNGSTAGVARANGGGVKRTGPNATAAAAAPSSWKRCRQEETAKQGASNSVLMNLLVSGCDVSAGYVCFTSPKSKNSAAAAVASVAPRQRHSRFYEQQQRRNVTAK